MFSEKFPIIDPLSAGHAQADRRLAQEQQASLEAEADRQAEMLDTERRQRQVELDELYKKDEGETVMDDIDPSRRS